MPLYTTYLARLTKLYEKDEEKHRYTVWLSKEDTSGLSIGNVPLNPLVFFVMCNRGNPEVEPPKTILDVFLSAPKNERTGEPWEAYRNAYLDSIRGDERSQSWMQNVAKLTKDNDVVLVCFEKDAVHCHRTLLAEDLVRFYGVDYRGEL